MCGFVCLGPGDLEVDSRDRQLQSRYLDIALYNGADMRKYYEVIVNYNLWEIYVTIEQLTVSADGHVDNKNVML